MQKNFLRHFQQHSTLWFNTFCLVVACAGLAACNDAVVPATAPSATTTSPITANVASATGCGIDQLRNGKPSGRGDRDLGRLGDPPPRTLRGVVVTANFPQQWHGTNGNMSSGMTIITQYSPAWECQIDGSSTYTDAGEFPLVTDSVVAQSPPAGIDSVEWNMLPNVLKRLMLDLANTFVENQFSCTIPAVGTVTCGVMRDWVVRTIHSTFKAGNERASVDVAEIQRRVDEGLSPKRRLTVPEQRRINAFSLGCALEGRLRTGELDGMLAASESEDWASKLGSASISLTLPQTDRYLEPRLAELVLSGAKASRVGNSCYPLLQEMMSAPHGNNWLLDGGLGGNGGGDGGGGTQF